MRIKISALRSDTGAFSRLPGKVCANAGSCSSDRAIFSHVDYSQILRELRMQREILDRAIRELESIAAGDGGPKRRGRKSMGPEERLQVSARMKKYWAARRRKANG